MRRRGPRGPGWRPVRPSPPSSPSPGRAAVRSLKVGSAGHETASGHRRKVLFIQRFIFHALVALYCADTAKMLLLTEIEILFSEWSGEAEQRFYCSPDININIVQHTIKRCTQSGMFSVPNLISPVYKSEVDIVASSAAPSVQGWQGWLPVHGWVMIIFLPLSERHQPIRVWYRLGLTNQRPVWPRLISLFCPHQSYHWWAFARTIIMPGSGQEN